MITAGFTIGLVTLLFVGSLLATNVSRRRWCSMCAAVSGTWLVLLVLWSLGKVNDPVLIAVLMGESVVGGMYLFERMARRAGREALLIFRFPLVLAGTLAVYAVLGVRSGLAVATVITLVVWLVAVGLYVYRTKEAVRGTVKKLIACCKNW